MEEVKKTVRDVIEHRISTADMDERDCSSLLADAVIAALDTAGFVIVPKISVEAIQAETLQRADEIRKSVEETRQRIRDGARPSKGRFKLSP